MTYIPFIDFNDYDGYRELFHPDRERDCEEFRDELDTMLINLITVLREEKDKNPDVKFYLSFDSANHGQLELMQIVGYEDMPHLIVYTNDENVDDKIHFNYHDVHFFNGESLPNKTPSIWVGRYMDTFYTIYKTTTSNHEGRIGLSNI